MSNSAYLSDQRVYFDEAHPTSYYGYTLSTSGSIDNLEWFKSESSRKLFEACVARSSLEYGVVPTSGGIRMASAYLLLTEIGEVDFDSDFLEREEILLAEVQWSDLLNACENRSPLQLLMPEEELIISLLLQYTDETVEWVLFRQLIRECVVRHKHEGYPVNNTVVAYDHNMLRALDIVGDIAESSEVVTRATLVAHYSFVQVTGKGIAQIFSTGSSREALDGVMAELEKIRQDVWVRKVWLNQPVS